MFYEKNGEIIEDRYKNNKSAYIRAGFKEIDKPIFKKVSRYDELKALNRTEQFKLCKTLGIKGYVTLKEADLIKLIMEAE